ncbi:MAG: phospho-N-acetylmuramoyl-pentapeptide-transferase [Clostridiales bacterium]|jgi:phospho-N-acetylmuramoyl-pentapeptide-transferase|nr:phospho-N-acetylmuramoyl-pentapeptide-transferase [Clostridiales bacterium]
MSSAVYAVLIAFVANIILCPILIPQLHRLKFGQNIRGDGPSSHLKKAGTPTMGGIMIIVSFILAALPFMRGNPEGAAVMWVTAAFGLVGFADDVISIVKKRSLGLKPSQKIIAQLVISIAFFLYWRTLPGYSTVLTVPFFPDISFDIGFFYPFFVIFIFLASSNGANLTDGLDGLAAGVTALIATFFMFAAWSFGSNALPITGAAVGSLMGFLLFNSHPARVIMGDTGSLALGGFIASISVLLRMPLFLVIVAIIYVIESLSVMIQVGYFKLTRKRFFKMAPIHHSFELSGWAETKVVAVFYVVTAMACLLGYLAMRGI